MREPLETWEELRSRGLLDEARAVAEAHHVDLFDLLGRSRERSIARARAALYVRLHGLGLSSPEIGRALDRDHSTVLAGLHKAGIRRGAPAASGAA